MTITSPISGSVGYRYDLAGNRSLLVYPDGRLVAYSYDGVNRLINVLPSGGPAGWATGSTTYAYNAVGQPITTTLPNGVTTLNGYDAAHRLISITHRTVTETLSAYVYTLDAVGNRTAVQEVGPAGAPLPAYGRVSVANLTRLEANAQSETPAISDDGEVVVFRSTASNLVPNDTNGVADIFVHYRRTGITRRVSEGAGGVEANSWSDQPALSASGCYVVFRSHAGNLVSPDDNFEDVFWVDLLTGEIQLINRSSSGVQDNCNSVWPVTSPDGRYVVFGSCGNQIALGVTQLAYRIRIYGG